MPLTDTKVKNAKTGKKSVKVADGSGMYLLVVTGRADRDPTADLKGALPPAKSKHFAAITDPKEVGPLLRAIDACKRSSVVKWALQLAHAGRDPLGRACNRTTHLPERRAMMQQWADRLDSLKQAVQAASLKSPQ